jgi:hypothetical protein
MRSLAGIVCLAALLSTVGCSSSSPSPAPGGAAGSSGVAPLALKDGCNPLLAGADCFLPYPSDVFRVADATLPSGFRVETPGASKMKAGRGGSADPSEWRPMDGFSKMPPIVALLGGPVSTTGLSGLMDPPAATMAATSPTLLIDAATGALIPHFADVDPREEDPSKQALVIHPLVGLKEKTRYVVALHGVKGPDGTAAPAPEGFRRLRDKVTGDPELTALAGRYEADVFDVTTKAGVARGDLQLAWDFTTGSDEHVSADMLKVRELTLAWLAQNQPVVTVTEVKEAPSADLWRTIKGNVQIPLFLEAAPSPSTDPKLFRDGAGLVAQNGTATVDFVVNVPISVRDQAGPGRVLGFGHGFFGTTDEVSSGSTVTIEKTLSAVTIGINWWGMSNPDQGIVANQLAGDPGLVFNFTDRVHQAMANWIVVMAAVRGKMKDAPAFHRPMSGPGVDPMGANAGALVYDDATLNFLGISQGHILAGTLAAVHPTIDRFTLNVGGAGLSTMMFRAAPFTPFLLILSSSTSLPSKLDQQKFAAAAQRHFDRVDPGFWASYVLQNKLPGSPADRRVLQQAGIGDSQVPNEGSFLHARLLGIPQIVPSKREVFGLETKMAPVDGSAFTLWDFGVDDSFYEIATAPKGTVVHDKLRVDPAAMAQMDAFFRKDSQITNPCGGVCVAKLHAGLTSRGTGESYVDRRSTSGARSPLQGDSRMNKTAFVATVALSLAVAACGKESSSAAPTADAKPTTPAANAPAHADEKPALPPSVKSAAPNAGGVAPEVPSGNSGPPTVDEWNAAASVNTAEKNSVAKDCTMKMVREWLKVNCTGKIKEATNMEGFGKKNFDYFELVTPGRVADFVVRVKKGGSLKVRILRDGEPGASLFVNWPGQLDKPSIIALANFGG